MKKKIVILILAVIIIAIPVTFMIVRHNEAETAMAEDGRRNRGRKTSLIVGVMYFEPFVQTYDYTEILLVHSEAEADALDLPNYVRVLWPTDATLATLIEMNNIIIRNEIDLSEFGLTYPITIDDLIYNWELVHDLYSVGFSNNDRDDVMLYMPIHLRTIREEAAREENQE